MGIFVRHEPCPKCGSRDNLGRYADGSAHCFGGCGYYERADRLPVATIKEERDESIQVDDDLCSDFPGHVVEWLARYGISVQEALRHGWKYGPKRDQLVFLFYGSQGELCVTQARNFAGASKRKYFTQGSVVDLLPIFSPPVDSRELVVVEDVVSAAKVSRQVAAMPLLGSHMPLSKFRRLRILYDKLYFWLDSDKLNESRTMAEQAKWVGFETRVIYTPNDPKEYSDDEISTILE